MSSLIVLDSERVPPWADAYKMVHGHPSINRIFSSELHTTDIGRVLESVSGRDDVVVMVGPTFLREHAERKEEMLYSIFAKAGLPSDRLVIVHHFGGTESMLCEWQRRIVYDPIPEVVIRALY